MNALIGTLVRFAVWMARREASREKTHAAKRFEGFCPCEPCQWARGLEQDADATPALEKWR